jgi:hypothetical protein
MLQSATRCEHVVGFMSIHGLYGMPASYSRSLYSSCSFFDFLRYVSYYLKIIIYFVMIYFITKKVQTHLTILHI